MKILLLIQVVLFSIVLSGCAGEPAANSSNISRMNARTPPPPPMPPQSNSTTNRASNSMSNARSNSLPKNANIQATPLPSPPASEKKDEGLFSFPPPKVISYSMIDNASLINREGQTTFSQVAEKLAGSLDNAGYKPDKYSYFWNEKDEFAVVTSMERIDADGAPLEGEERWEKSAKLPEAGNTKEYFDYLISGKKVYYRVFAFIVTSKRTGRSFYKGISPDFLMASSWMNKGEDQLGGGVENSTIEEVIYTDKYKCFALLYLFVNHTSLDAPKSVDKLEINEERLREGLKQETQIHLNNARIKFGG
jgi:hypothetical protein